MDKVKAQPMSERAFQRRVTETAVLYGWIYHHCRAALDHGQFRTPISGHAGYPDLTLTRNGIVIFAELKSDIGTTSETQDRWLGALAQCSGVRVRTWRPRDWDAVLKELK